MQAWRGHKARAGHARVRAALAVLARHAPMFQAHLLRKRLALERQQQQAAAVAVQSYVRMHQQRRQYLATIHGVTRLQVGVGEGGGPSLGGLKLRQVTVPR